MPLLEFTTKGIYCEAGDFFIDPWQSVDKAIITHAHSDHAKPGMKHYLTHHLSREVLKLRLGKNISVQSVGYGEPVFFNGVKVSLHPAGHLPGSAQIRVEYKGEVWVNSGDYKVEDDGLSQVFEPVACHCFITETTFGLPIFDWAPQQQIFEEIKAWWKSNQENGITSIINAYSLGKAQRLLHNLGNESGDIYVHSSIYKTNEALKASHLKLPDCKEIPASFDFDSKAMPLIIAPGSFLNGPGSELVGPIRVANCSGWMAISRLKNQTKQKGFVLSDHADWKGLISAIKATGASQIITNHGYTKSFARYLNENGFSASEARVKVPGYAGLERVEDGQNK